MLRLSSLFSDHAVMQREKFVRIWGWCAPNELVKLEFCGESLTVWSDETGAFFFLLPPQNAGGPHTMTVRCKDEVLQRTDIYFGEVYLAGGQSNMEMPLEGWPVPFPEEDLNSLRFQYPVRLFKVPLLADVRRHSDVNAKWLLPTRENYPEMSAVGTFFADMLSQALEIPVGSSPATGVERLPKLGSAAKLWLPILILPNNWQIMNAKLMKQQPNNFVRSC